MPVPRPAQGRRQQHRLDRALDHRARSRRPRRWRASRSARSTPASRAATSARRHPDGVAAIAGGEVTRADVERVLEGARAIPVDADRQILHVLPREYIVDNQDGIRDPIGMSGVRLGAKVNLVTAATTLRPERRSAAPSAAASPSPTWCSEPLASAEAVLSEDEREIGVAVVDIGGGTTDILLYVDGGIAHASVIPVGGNNITTDIAAGLRTPMGEAERLKRNLRLRARRMVGDDEEIEVPGVGGHEAAQRRAPRALGDIIEPRVEEIFAVVRKRIEDTGMLEQLSAGVVLTGGAVLLEGMTEFAEEILGMPVRLGVPVGVRRHHPARPRPAVRDGRGPGAVRRQRAGRGPPSRTSNRPSSWPRRAAQDRPEPRDPIGSRSPKR